MTKLKYKNSGLIYSLMNNKFLVFFSNIIFQGIRYMSVGEKLYKISLTIFFSLIFFQIFRIISLSIFLGHLLNYVVNGQFYVVFRYLSSKRTMSYEDLHQFINLIDKYILIFKPKDILIIGSFSRGKMGKSSDLDVRLYHNESLTDSLKAYFMATILRASGLFIKFPIDIFCFSDCFITYFKCYTRSITTYN